MLVNQTQSIFHGKNNYLAVMAPLPQLMEFIPEESNVSSIALCKCVFWNTSYVKD